MATGQQTTAHDWMNFYVGHLTADITSSSTDIFIDTIPTPTESCLVIDPDTPADTEVIFYTSKTATKVTTPANGRGYDGSAAVAHLTGTKVILAPIGDDFRYIRTLATTTPQGWSAVANTPNTVTANGNRSYTCVFNAVDLTSTLSPGMRLKTTRTVAAPTQCTSLNGTTQYYSKTSPAGMTFTNNFVVSAWVKLSSYVANSTIASRYTAAGGGWSMQLSSAGQISFFGFNASTANYFQVQAYQSLPLNKWVHIAAQMDMTSTTNSPTVNYVMIDGVDVPALCTRAGTNPTSLTSGVGNLEIGSGNAGTNFFPGKIAQVAIYSAKVTQATILASMHQTLAGTETSLISAYSFNNSINDLNANANNLTANGSAVATNADSPFGGQAGGSISSTLDYGIITSASFSTNTTLVVQVPEGCTIPTSGGVSAVSYSTVGVPYGFPKQEEKWTISAAYGASLGTVSISALNQYFALNAQLNIPVGEWAATYEMVVHGVGGTNVKQIGTLLAPATPTNAVRSSELYAHDYDTADTTDKIRTFKRTAGISLAAATPYLFYGEVIVNSGATTMAVRGDLGLSVIKAKCAFI